MLSMNGDSIIVRFWGMPNYVQLGKGIEKDVSAVSDVTHLNPVATATTGFSLPLPLNYRV